MGKHSKTGPQTQGLDFLVQWNKVRGLFQRSPRDDVEDEFITPAPAKSK